MLDVSKKGHFLQNLPLSDVLAGSESISDSSESAIEAHIQITIHNGIKIFI